MTAQISAALLPGGRPWELIVADVEVNWLIYLSIPLVAAVIGYGTKLVALKMLYWPIEFRGLGPIGWQGVVPRRAGKTAALTIHMLQEKLLRPEEILDRIDPSDAVAQLREPLLRATDEMARELLEEIRPGLWDSMPARGREMVRNRVQAVAPRVIDNLLEEMRADLSRFVDLQYVAVTVLVRNKEQLNRLMQGLGGAAMQFIRRSGIYFGLAIGCVQMVAWGYYHNRWIMPIFGGITGFLSDWLALNLIFTPREKRKLFGFIPVHGTLHAQREQVTRDYARLLANDIFSADVLLDAILRGHTADRLFAVVAKEVDAAIDAEAGLARPVLTLAIGTRRYREIKERVVQLLIDRLPDTMAEAQDYATRALDIENLIIEKMNLLTPEEYEGILRPVFKDDEMMMVMVGAMLGFGVGELQVLMVELLSQPVQ
ncbi:DUF445 domain-containing protein [Nocardioides limicola]|uniref:DUF445 domain-containing protein n=1 Tax=Nocardioides limicola TaxID=2803368 RepID=UPI00193C6A2F|nr:DUF445 domain-containing protein [Nocardioides sp. DJM-14]